MIGCATPLAACCLLATCGWKTSPTTLWSGCSDSSARPISTRPRGHSIECMESTRGSTTQGHLSIEPGIMPERQKLRKVRACGRPSSSPPIGPLFALVQQLLTHRALSADIPANHLWIDSAAVTPTRVLFFPPSAVQSNRVLRHWEATKQLGSYFLRVSFVDECLNQLCIQESSVNRVCMHHLTLSSNAALTLLCCDDVQSDDPEQNCQYHGQR